MVSGPVSTCFVTVLTVLKFGWIILGLLIFLKLDFTTCSMLLKNFGTAYYLAFLYFLIRFAIFMLKMRKRGIEKEMLENILLEEYDSMEAFIVEIRETEVAENRKKDMKKSRRLGTKKESPTKVSPLKS